MLNSEVAEEEKTAGISTRGGFLSQELNVSSRPLKLDYFIKNLDFSAASVMISRCKIYSRDSTAASRLDTFI